MISTSGTSTKELLNYADQVDLALMVVSVLDLKRMPVLNRQSKFITDASSYKNLIINADSNPTGFGSHWTALHANNNYVILYDPFGAPPAPEILAFAKKFHHRKAIINITNGSQDPKAATCGHWCIYFLYCMNNGIKLTQYLAALSDNTEENEKLLKKFFDML